MAATHVPRLARALVATVRRLYCLILGHRWKRDYGYGTYLAWPLTCDRCGHQV